MADLRLKGLRRVYPNGHVAVEGADLDIRAGEFLVLVGPSGSGKSTTLRMIAGLEDISAGDLYIGGQRMNDVDAQDRNIAMVFQNYALYPHMTVYDNMAFALRNRGHKRAEIERRVNGTAATLGLSAYLRAKPGQLSGGQRQRVALGRAIVRRADVFLFDEPLSNLDAQMRVQMRAELARLHRSLERTMIYVTHDQMEAMTLGDRIVVMDKGRIQQVGTPLDVYRRPANRFVASFIGSPAMNFLSGHLAAGTGHFHLKGAGGCVMFPLPAACTKAAQSLDGSQRPVELGIRPEHIGLLTHKAPGALPALLDSFETTGSDAFAYVRLGQGCDPNMKIAVRVPPAPPLKPDMPVWLRIAGPDLHFFDPDSGQALHHASHSVG